MATTTPQAQALIAEAVTAATAVASASNADEYSTRQQAEAAIGAARSAIQAAIDAARDEYGIPAYPVVKALRELAARLLDLDRALAEELQTMEYTVVSERSLVDLALQLYGTSEDTDILQRVRDLHTLNPGLQNPVRIPTGTTLVVYVR